ncbi:MAG: hypothetical protein JHC95_11885 [Solirubrobacteraceae bacterium]|nr:hypothetical protein [Solirubrobacteraceae bacterium]
MATAPRRAGPGNHAEMRMYGRALLSGVAGGAMVVYGLPHAQQPMRAAAAEERS